MVDPIPQQPNAYDEAFFTKIKHSSVESAAVVVPIVLDLLRVTSVVDVGCGEGAWLSVFEEHGVPDVCGLDGEYVDVSRLAFDPSAFFPVDLKDAGALVGAAGAHAPFDLVVSLEVAEHLPESSADEFVSSLAALGDAVLFSAAIPGQFGDGHVNCQWPDYWAQRFRDAGFECFDPVRLRTWTDNRVAYWYSQNALLYVRPERVKIEPGLAGEPPVSPPVRLVHPDLYSAVMADSQAQIDRLRRQRSVTRRVVGRARRALRAG